LAGFFFRAVLKKKLKKLDPIWEKRFRCYGSLTREKWLKGKGIMRMSRGVWVAGSIVWFCHLLVSPSALGEPRQPFPPWPEASLGNYRWNSLMWPEHRTLNEHAATYAESWSGYGYERQEFRFSPRLQC
jgi:hypothetical protein